MNEKVKICASPW